MTELHHPISSSGGPQPAQVEGDASFWHGLIDEKVAADFLGMTDRFMQNRRQQGDGCRYIAISARCIRYRRRDLKAWADGLVRTSTSDPSQEAA